MGNSKSKASKRDKIIFSKIVNEPKEEGDDEELYPNYLKLENVCFVKYYTCRHITEGKKGILFIKNNDFEFEIKVNRAIMTETDPRDSIYITKYNDLSPCRYVLLRITKSSIINPTISSIKEYKINYIGNDVKYMNISCIINKINIIVRIKDIGDSVYKFCKTPLYNTKDILKHIEKSIHSITDTTEPIFDYSSFDEIAPPQYVR